MTLHVGTSGWHYRHWRGVFYPDGMPSREYLAYYAGRLATVEVNASFYRLPRPDTLSAWRDATPPDFVFSFKASRYLTHMKKLKDAEDPISRMIARAEELSPKLGPILLQLPPSWRVDIGRLADFLALLPDRHRFAFEFRDTSWFCDEVYDLLRMHDAAFCIYELGGRHSPKKTTASFVYIRLHGPGEAYEGSYDTEALAGWAGAISSWERSGREVFCYFDNDQAGYAVQNALELAAMLD